MLRHKKLIERINRGPYGAKAIGLFAIAAIGLFALTSLLGVWFAMLVMWMMGL